MCWLLFGKVCPRPERRYEAQIGLKEMEEQADRTAPVQRNLLAKWRLEALASRAQSHFAHLRSPFAVANCTLCRTSAVGRVVLEWVATVTSTDPTAPYPIHSPPPRQTVQASGRPSDSPLNNTVEVSLESTRKRLWARTLESSLLQPTCNTGTRSDVGSQMVGTMLRSSTYLLTDECKQMCRNELWTPTARQPLLPDRDAIATNAWSEVCNISLGLSLEDETDERILWPRGVCAYSGPFVRRFISDTLPLSKQAVINTGVLDVLPIGRASIRFPRPETLWIEQKVRY